MSKLLAAIDNSTTAAPVLAAAVALADLLGADVEAVHARENGHQTAQAAARGAGVALREAEKRGIAGLLQAAADPGVAYVVLGARSGNAGPRPAGHVALELARTLRKPVVLVPPDTPMDVELRRFLVPLDGTRTTADALATTVGLALRAKLEVVALHVVEYSDLPLFNDQPQHEFDAWAREFLRRHCPHPELVTLETRVGVPAEHVLGVAHEAGADMVALGWSQRLERGHAAVVRTVLAGSSIPVLLVAIANPLQDHSPQLGHAVAAAPPPD